jgi:hypothetical protein
VSKGIQFAKIRDLYSHFEYSDLVAHPAIVLIPYQVRKGPSLCKLQVAGHQGVTWQVSIMSIFEYYRMAIPLFVPSPSLLAKWQLKYR